MSDTNAPEIHLSDYTPPAYLVDTVNLTFHLHPTKTRVISRIAFRPNPETDDRRFFLNGEQLDFKSAKIDGVEITPDLTDQGLTAQVPDAAFVWECEVEIAPENNTALEGLYMSGGMYCSQCEAQGFRKITYYPDRPDVMGVFTVRIEGTPPVLLSNGNPGDNGDGFAEWHDPWPKPAYLFALVAGDLRNHPDTFTTMSGREVDLNIWVRPDDIDKCAFGMEALKKSMEWDEDVYGREYDLGLFNIVAVDDFNMGAMENKGLNIFNSSCVLASPETATDANFERIEAIIAHEYFHNWTGNRITCRDWFQLCLKEGLTVFRDQSFTGDERGHGVKRINDVIQLRGRQFSEDQGPLSHPVRPASFVEINNFYTATIYEKGAEVIGMLKCLVGDEDYDTALDLYFERHDGDAATIEDWLQVFEDSSGRDLTQFKRWYSQAGTPIVTLKESYNNGIYTLDLKQETPATPGQSIKEPQVLPIAIGLLSQNGDEVLETTILEMDQAEQSFSFEMPAGKPIPSILRGFSAPVVLNHAASNEERAFLMSHDTDEFNRWESGRILGEDVMLRMVQNGAAPDTMYLDALANLVRDDSLDPAYRALMIRPISQNDIGQSMAQSGHVPDPSKIYRAAQTMEQAKAQHLQDTLPRLYAQMHVSGPYSPDAEPVGKRALQGAVLSLITRLDGGMQARSQYASADNMTQQFGALTCLLEADTGEPELAAFYEQWVADRLVIDKWFGAQVGLAAPDKAASIADALTRHADFDMTNPNRFRAVFGGLSMNTAGFHNPTGAAYNLLADWLIALDPMNPQTTARMTVPFQTWRRFDTERQALMQAALERIAATNDLSPDTTEMVGRILKA